MKALVIVDVQNDFITGSLPVSGGQEVVPVINKILPYFPYAVATKDYHPKGHCSFSLWPEHCVRGSKGAELHPDLDLRNVSTFIFKGTQQDVDSYSGFIDNDGKSETVLHALLKARGITEVYVCGLATDYCVCATAIDAAKRGYKTFLVEDACRGVAAETTQKACDNMKAAGVQFTHSSEILQNPLCA